nr:translation initiation factor IF-2-like [Aegilops tauschii subsp. strangulata]
MRSSRASGLAKAGAGQGAARAGRRQAGVCGRGQGGRHVRASVSEAMADAVSTFGARSASVHSDGGEEVEGERPGASPGFAGSRAAVLEVGDGDDVDGVEADRSTLAPLLRAAGRVRSAPDTTTATSPRPIPRRHVTPPPLSSNRAPPRVRLSLLPAADPRGPGQAHSGPSSAARCPAPPAPTSPRLAANARLRCRPTPSPALPTATSPSAGRWTRAAPRRLLHSRRRRAPGSPPDALADRLRVKPVLELRRAAASASVPTDS